MRASITGLREFLLFAKRQATYVRGYTSELFWETQASPPLDRDSNPLRDFFEARQQGRGIWKWRHYFDIYHRHLQRFRGSSVALLEIGVYSGGSLDMWRDYFGPQAQIYGVDIEPACRAYESENVKIFIGDQSDRAFWRAFRERVQTLDIVIDDGGHLAEQQIVSLEELLSFLRPGGVYICEDIHRAHNAFMCISADYPTGSIQCR
jgi:SAM-dependent methyltransferase